MKLFWVVNYKQIYQILINNYNFIDNDNILEKKIKTSTKYYCKPENVLSQSIFIKYKYKLYTILIRGIIIGVITIEVFWCRNI